MELERDLQVKLAILLARHCLDWPAVPPEQESDGGFWSPAERRTRLVWQSELHQMRLAQGVNHDRPGDGFVWAPFHHLADAWLVHLAMCTQGPAPAAHYFVALAQRLRDKYGPPSVWTAPLALLEPADICLAALESLSQLNPDLHATLQTLAPDLLTAPRPLPDGLTPERVLTQSYSGGDNTLTVDAHNPAELELATHTMDYRSRTTVSLHPEAVQRLAGQLLLWLHHRPAEAKE